MAQQDPTNPIYKFLKENKLTQKSEADFMKEYVGNPKKQAELFKFFKENNLTKKDENLFMVEYFPSPGKPTEVSPQGSVATSQPSVEPTQNIDQSQELPTQQNGGLLEQSSLENDLIRANNIALEYGVGEQTYELEQLPGYRTVVGAVDENGIPLNPVRINESTGEVSNVIQPVEGASSVSEANAQNELIKQAEMSAGDKALNSIQNMWTHIKGLPAKTAILFDQNARFDASRFLALYGATQLAGTNPNQLRDDAYRYLDDLGAEMRQTGSIVDGLRSNDIGELAAGVFNATTSLLSSLAIGATSGGAGTVLDMVGGGVYDYNTKKAESLGISTEELFKQGKGDDIAPYIINSAAAGLERIGFKGVTSAINRNLTGSAVRKAGLFAFDSSKEAGTEWVQEGLSAYNEVIASGGTHEQAIEAMGKTMGSDRGIEAALGGFFGAAAASGGGRAIKGIIGKSAREKATKAQDAMQQIAQDYVNNTDPNIRATLMDAAVDTSDQMLEATNESKKSIEFLSLEKRDKIWENQSAIDTIDETLANGNLSKSTVSALEQRKEALNTEIEGIIKENDDRLSGLSDEDKQLVVDKESTIYALNEPSFKETLNERTAKRFEERTNKLKSEIEEILSKKKENETEQEVQPVATEQSVEVPMESVQVESIPEETGQTEGVVNEEAVQEVVEPVAETGPENQNVDVKQNEVITEAVSEEITPAEQTLATEEMIESTPVTEAIQETNNVQENTIQENEQTPVREEVVEESSSRSEMPPREQTNPKLKRLLKALPRQDVEAMRGPANVGYRQDVIEAVTGKRPTKKDAGINNVKSVLNEYFGLENAGSEASINDMIRNWANAERTEFSTPDEAVRYQAENTDNPDDILRLYDQEQPVFDERELRISEYLGSGKVNLKDYNRFGDYNNLDKNIVKNRIDETNSGIDLDVAAQELSDQLGYEVTPGEIVDFVTNYPTVEDYNASTKSDNQVLLEKRYKELTGRNITPKVMERFQGREAASVTDAELISRDPNMQELGVTAENVSDRSQMEASEGLSPTQAPLPKSLLKGVTDRLKLTGLAKGVKVTDTKGVSEELSKRTGKVSFQQEGYDAGTKQQRDMFDSLQKKTPSEVLDIIGRETASPDLKRVVDMLKKSTDRLSEFKLMTGDFPWRGLTENGRITVNTDAVFDTPSDLTTKRGLDSAFKTLVHEYVHAVTLAAYRNPRTKADKDFKSYIDKVYKALKNDAMFKDSMYGFTSETEFIAELMTNNEFRKLGPIQKRGVVGRVIDHIKKMLGFNVESEDQANSRRNKLMNDAFEYVLESVPNITQQGGILYQQGSSINGFYDPATGEIVINQDTAGLDTPIHEFGHAWEGMIEKENPELHAKGMELIQSEEGKPYVDHVRQTQPGLEGRELYKEALAQAIGDSGARLIESQQRSVIKEWLNAVWNYIATRTGISGMTPSQISNLTLREYTDAVAIDLLGGKKIASTDNGDVVVQMSDNVTNASSMNTDQKKISDFLERMRAKKAVQFQGNIEDGNSFSDDEFKEFIDVVRSLINTGQVDSLSDLREFAKNLGITNEGQINYAWRANNNTVVGIKKALVDAKTIAETDFEKITDAEYIELGKRMVDEGIIDVDEIVKSVLTEPRVLEPYEVTALIYARSLVEQRIDEISGGNILVDAVQDLVSSDRKVELAALYSKLRDFDMVSLYTANRQSAAFRLRSVLTDKDYNVLEYFSAMEQFGEIPADVRLRMEELGKELEQVKSELRKRTEELQKRKRAKETSSINKASTAKTRPSQVQTKQVRQSKADAISVIDSLDFSDFGIPGISFQTNGVVQFSLNTTPVLNDAVRNAVAEMKSSLESGKSLVDSLESAVEAINKAVGKGKWDELKFRSKIINDYTDKGHSPMAKKPYVAKDGSLVVPTEYLKQIVSEYRSDNNNAEMSIEEMTDAVSKEVGPGFNKRDIMDSISGYGRSASNTRSDEVKNIQTARSIGKLLAELEDLEKRGPNPKSKNSRKVNERIADLRKMIQALEDSMTSTPEEKAQMKQERAAQAKIKYINNYIERLNEKINNKEFEPEVKNPVYDFSDDPRIIELEKKREEIRNKFKAEKYKHEMKNQTAAQKAWQWFEGTFFGLARTISAGSDVSSFLIQGGLITFADPKRSVKALKSSVMKAGSTAMYDDYFTSLQRDPMFEVARKAKLNLQLPNFYQQIVEEQLGSSNMLTVFYEGAVDKVIKNEKVAQRMKDWFPPTAAERQYALFLSDVRFGLFKQVATDAINYQGVDPSTPEGKAKLSEIAEAVNDITMASNIKSLQGATTVQKALNLLLFSTRKLAANFKILYKLPTYTGAYLLNKSARIAGYNKVVNDLEFKSMIFQRLYGRYAGAGLALMASTVLIPTLIANATYDEDEDDEPPLLYNPHVLNPIHSDFMKMKIGESRFSPFLGIEGAIGLIARLATQSYMTSTSEKVKEFGKRDGMKVNNTGLQVLTQFMQNKLAPTPSILTAKFLGSEFQQRESNDRIVKSFAPMWFSGGFEEYEKTGNMGWALGTTALGIFGANFNTYGGAQFASAQGTKNDDAYNLMKKIGISDYTPDFRNKPMLDEGNLVEELSKKKMKDVYAPAYNEYMTFGVLAKKGILLDATKTQGAKEAQVDNIKKEAYRYAELKTTGYIVDANFKSFTHEGVKYSLTKEQYKEKMKLIDKFMKDPSLSGDTEKRYVKEDVIDRLDKDGISRDKNYIRMRSDIEMYNRANRWANDELSYNFVTGKYIPTAEYDPDKDNSFDNE